MIKKIGTIKNLGVFQNFEWDKSVKTKDGLVAEFSHINIFYGRNYSGKTTLSRILRAIETGSISDKYDNPIFKIDFKDGTSIQQNSINSHKKKVRVFNEDFVKENLKFISNPNDNIESFAILGDDNNTIESKINELNAEIGSNKTGEESGLYLKLKQADFNFNNASNNHRIKKNDLFGKISAKATDKIIGIKYKSEEFGDQNYTKPKLDNEIEIVLKPTYIPITTEKQNSFETLIKESSNATIPIYPKVSLTFSNLVNDARLLITQKVGATEKIEELLKDAILNRWVKEGRQLHKETRTKCAFCNNEIDEARWGQLEKHFDEESLKLEKSIDELILKISDESSAILKGFNPNKNLFYSKFQSIIDRLASEYSDTAKKYEEQLSILKNKLLERKNDLINPKVFIDLIDYTCEIEDILTSYEQVRLQSNAYSNSLTKDQKDAKDSLRLKEIFEYLKTINYLSEIKSIQDLQRELDKSKVTKGEVEKEISDKNQLIESLKRELKNETKGAEKVNEYLNNFFGHGFLSLRTVENNSFESSVKSYKFEITRDGKKAFHLSEGECSLIAFCYFMAKLEDIETKGAKPIIWIDDPISSLDSNHIFFVYSLINTQIVESNIFEQLFISTHNLDFLKYLKRLPGANNDMKKKEISRKYRYLLINRNDKFSDLQIMPDYLREYVTEFNFLFHQIYKCSSIEIIDDSNYTIFYNFGNNARKFLEIYLYYRYPDSGSESDKLLKFFGNEKIPSILSDRINNEYSHLCGIFERGAIPIEQPEMKASAQIIINRIKETDLEQYQALLTSIGER